MVERVIKVVTVGDGANTKQKTFSHLVYYCRFFENRGFFTTRRCVNRWPPSLGMMWTMKPRPRMRGWQSGHSIKILSGNMTQCGGDEALHWSAGKGSICYESWRGANGAILHNNALLCTFSTRLREHNIHRCWQLNNRCTQKNVIFLLNSIMLTQLWILNLQEMDYRGCMSWRHANKWHEDIHLAVSACARVCEDCKIYSESCRGGLEGSYVGDLIKNLVCKNKKAKAIHFCANRHHESDQQEKTNAERRGCLMHA